MFDKIELVVHFQVEHCDCAFIYIRWGCYLDFLFLALHVFNPMHHFSVVFVQGIVNFENKYGFGLQFFLQM